MPIERPTDIPLIQNKLEQDVHLALRLAGGGGGSSAKAAELHVSGYLMAKDPNNNGNISGA